MAKGSTKWLLLLAIAAAPPAGGASGPKQETADGYLEWRRGDLLIVDGQRVRPVAGHKFRGKDAARDAAAIPLGYEVKATGTRDRAGTLLAREIEARPNASALFEKEVVAMTDEAEAGYRRAQHSFETAADGRMKEIGALHDSGPRVDRCRRMVRRLLPPYLQLPRRAASRRAASVRGVYNAAWTSRKGGPRWTTRRP